MAEECATCGEVITKGGLLSDPNMRIDGDDLRITNFVNKTDYVELCQKCGSEIRSHAYIVLQTEIKKVRKFIEMEVSNFPMMTIGAMPQGVDFRVLGMVTANVTIGTGLFNEFSQGFSDFFGAVNAESGMALKVNKGEAAARGILAQKAIQLGASCIIGVDVDYGVTNNNAATVNMQGTAIKVREVDKLLSDAGVNASTMIAQAMSRLQTLNRWLAGEIAEGEEFSQ